MKPFTPTIGIVSTVAVLVVLSTGSFRAQGASTADLVALLKKGGYVLVMRHASSPRDTPDKQAASAGNVNLERQLDEAGRSGATAMGKALRDLAIPVGEVLSSPTYRACLLYTSPSPRDS